MYYHRQDFIIFQVFHPYTQCTPMLLKSCPCIDLLSVRLCTFEPPRVHASCRYRGVSLFLGSRAVSTKFWHCQSEGDTNIGLVLDSSLVVIYAYFLCDDYLQMDLAWVHEVYLCAQIFKNLLSLPFERSP